MRDTLKAAKLLVTLDDEELETIAQRDPSMIRDVAAAHIVEQRAQPRDEPEVSTAKGGE